MPAPIRVNYCTPRERERERIPDNIQIVAFFFAICAVDVVSACGLPTPNSWDLYQNLFQMVRTGLQVYRLISELHTPVMSRVLRIVASIFNAARRALSRVSRNN